MKEFEDSKKRLGQCGQEITNHDVYSSLRVAFDNICMLGKTKEGKYGKPLLSPYQTMQCEL